MGWFSHRRSNVPVRPEQKWDYIQLNDFKSKNGFTYIAYGYLFLSLTISLAVYAVDTFTAINLLIFNKWSSEIKPSIPFDVAKWIFSICIILSFVNVAYEHLRAQIIMRRGSVAECYLDNLAVRLESIKLGSGRGWRRFLVFAELTKSKKGAEYIALFTYFSFQAWIRILLCSGPRQVVNAVTLYSVYNAKLAVDGDSFESSLESLMDKIKALAEQDYQQALILSGMLFTFVIWVFSILAFILALLFFVFFLWGWIPREDGGLSGYCERKINKRLMKIVSAKVDAAIADQERQRKKAELKAAKKAGEAPAEERKATLPTLMPASSDDKLPDMPMLKRQDTVATLPVYTSRPGTPGDYELNQMRPPMPTRTDTTSTASTRAPLLRAQADMGRSSPAPSLPSPNFGPMRSPLGPPVQTNASNFGGTYTSTPSSYSPDNDFPSMPQPVRSDTMYSNGSYGMPARSTPAPMGSFDDYSSNGRASPAPSRQMGPRPTYEAYSRPAPPSYGQQGGYHNYPARSQTGPAPQRGPHMQQSQRNMTAPVAQHAYPGPPPDEYFNRPGTAQSQRSFNAAPPMPGYGLPDFERPGTAQSQRSFNGGPPAQRQQNRPPYGGGGGGGGQWTSDMESQRGTPGPRY